MSKHLFCDTKDFTSNGNLWLEVGHIKYIKLRLQFWKYHLHYTMGRPILIPWRGENK